MLGAFFSAALVLRGLRGCAGVRRMHGDLPRARRGLQAENVRQRRDRHGDHGKQEKELAERLHRSIHARDYTASSAEAKALIGEWEVKDFLREEGR